MIKIYYNLIINRIINPNTNLPYALSDVPDKVIGGKNIRDEVEKLILGM